MHELSLAKDIVQRAIKEAENQAAKRVDAVTVRIGLEEHFSPEALTFSIQAASKGSVAEGAQVRIKIVREDGVVLESIDIPEED
jgi:hydrogenase nickel incorporation protein HypA/HybF